MRRRKQADISCTSKHKVRMNRIDTARRAQVIRCLVEGNSINSTCRMTGVAKNTVLKLLVEVGAACSAYLDVTCEISNASDCRLTKHGRSAIANRRILQPK